MKDLIPIGNLPTVASDKISCFLREGAEDAPYFIAFVPPPGIPLVSEDYDRRKCRCSLLWLRSELGWLVFICDEHGYIGDDEEHHIKHSCPIFLPGEWLAYRGEKPKFDPPKWRNAHDLATE